MIERLYRRKDGKNRSILTACRLTPNDRKTVLSLGKGSVTEGIQYLLRYYRGIVVDAGPAKD